MFISQLPHAAGDPQTAAYERARAWLSRELHDDIAQRIALLSAELGVLRQRLTNASGEILEHVAKLATETAGIGADVSRIARVLPPAEFERLGIEASIRRCCAQLVDAFQMTVDLDLDEVHAPVGLEASLCVYRIAQEALHNVVKHSGASHASVSLKAVGGELVLRVTDDGVGFDPRAVRSTNTLGLMSMRERAALVRARLVVLSKPGHGTAVAVHVPVRQSAPADSSSDRL